MRGSTFKTALDLAQTFPFGVLASQACPYCYDTGYSSPVHGAAIVGIAGDDGARKFGPFKTPAKEF